MEFLEGFDDFDEGGKTDEWTSAEEVQEATQRALQLAQALRRPSRAALVLTVYQDLIEEICGDICFSMHRGAKLGIRTSSDLATKPSEGPLVTRVVASQGTDVFGAQLYPTAATDEVSCDNCDRKVQAARYAPHLQKCLGKGRNCQRAASRRLSSMAAQNQQSIYNEEDDDADADADDHVFGKKKKKKKAVVAVEDEKTKKKKRKKLEALAGTKSSKLNGNSTSVPADEVQNLDEGFDTMEFGQWPSWGASETRETAMGDDSSELVNGSLREDAAADNFVDLSGA